MTLKYYHAEPVANSLKSMIPLKEKGLAFESHYVDLHKFEQHEPWFVKINPEGQVPVLIHDDIIITHTSVINEYIEDVFPEIPLRPASAEGKAKMRYWNKFVDEHVTNQVSMHGWHRMIRVVTKEIESGEFEKLMERIPLPHQREKWRTARGGFSDEQLAEATAKIEFAVDKVEKQLAKTPWLAGDEYSLADINFFCHCGMMVDKMFPEMDIPKRAPNLTKWSERMFERPAIKDALGMPDHTNPKLRTFTGEVK